MGESVAKPDRSTTVLGCCGRAAGWLVFGFIGINLFFGAMRTCERLGSTGPSAIAFFMDMHPDGAGGFLLVDRRDPDQPLSTPVGEVWVSWRPTRAHMPFKVAETYRVRYQFFASEAIKSGEHRMPPMVTVGRRGYGDWLDPPTGTSLVKDALRRSWATPKLPVEIAGPLDAAAAGETYTVNCPRSWAASVVTWIVAAALPPTVISLRRKAAAREARRADLCPACRYDISASGDTCPECGHGFFYSRAGSARQESHQA